MLKVRVELWPGGRQDEKHQIAVLHLSNVTDSVTNGLEDYAIFASEGVNPPADRGCWQSRGLIAGHDRRQTVWALVAKAAAWAASEAEKR
jgi:hypothetical protein